MMVNPAVRLNHLARVAQAARNVPGAFVECGVQNGYSAAFLAATTRGARCQHVWLFDSFQGLPEPTAEDGEFAAMEWPGRRGEWCLGSEKRVRRAFAEIGWPEDRLHVVPGWFENTLTPEVIGQIGPIALLHVDADWYGPTLLALERLSPGVVPGGIVAVDDYHYWEGSRKAVEAFAARQGAGFRVVRDPDYWYARRVAA